LSSYPNTQATEEYQEFTFEGHACPGCKNRVQDALMCQIDGARCDFVNNCVKLPHGREEEARRIISSIEPSLSLVAVKKEEDTGLTDSWHSQLIRKQMLLFALAFVLFAGGFAFQYLLPHLDEAKTAMFLTSYLLMGLPVIRIALTNLLAGKLFDENFLMTIASFGAVAVGHIPEAAGVMLFYRTGEFLQDRAVDRSRRMITSLMDIRPDTATLKLNGTTVNVPAASVKIGETIVVKPGEKIPLDGTVVEGSSFLNTSALTGEHVPKRVYPGQHVLAGSVNTTGVLEIRVSSSFENSSVSKLLELVEKAGERKANTEKFITRFSKYYTPLVVSAAAAVAVVPLLVIEGAVFSDWFYRALIMLVVSCPCALVISIPLGYFGGIGGASRKGILVKGANFLDALTQVDTVIFDKTGTLTRGEFKVSKITAFKGYTQKEVIQLAAEAELYSNHPIALSILEYYRKEYAELTEPNGVSVKEYREFPGKGVIATVNGRELLVGNKLLMEEAGISYPQADPFGTTVYVAVDKVVAGVILISDTIRKDAASALAKLKEAGIRKTVMLTGDQEQAATHVAGSLGIDEFYYGLLPEDKVAHLERLLQERNASGKGNVAFVGDGINDAPVIRAADIGFALGGLGSDAAIESADVVIMNDALEKIPLAVEIARFTKRIVVENIILALGVKGLVVILGTAGVASLWEAVFADVGVALLAILNATRCLNYKKTPSEKPAQLIPGENIG